MTVNKRNNHNMKLVVPEAFLWIYSSKTGALKKFDNVQIYQRLNGYGDKALNQFYAISNVGIDRLVSGIENGVWYYSRYREYLIWSKTDNYEHIKNVLMRTLQQKAKEDIRDSLSTLKHHHDILDKAYGSLMSNCIVTVGSYEEVETAINRYFQTYYTKE